MERQGSEAACREVKFLRKGSPSIFFLGCHHGTGQLFQLFSFKAVIGLPDRESDQYCFYKGICLLYQQKICIPDENKSKGTGDGGCSLCAGKRIHGGG